MQFEYSKTVVQDQVEKIDPANLENLPVGVDGAAYYCIVKLTGKDASGLVKSEYLSKMRFAG